MTLIGGEGRTSELGTEFFKGEHKLVARMTTWVNDITENAMKSPETIIFTSQLGSHSQTTFLLKAFVSVRLGKSLQDPMTTLQLQITITASLLDCTQIAKPVY